MLQLELVFYMFDSMVDRVYSVTVISEHQQPAVVDNTPCVPIADGALCWAFSLCGKELQ